MYPESRFDDNYANVYYAQEELRKTCMLIALVRSIMKSSNVKLFRMPRVNAKGICNLNRDELFCLTSP
jgi:hypothetical protein